MKRTVPLWLAAALALPAYVYPQALPSQLQQVQQTQQAQLKSGTLGPAVPNIAEIRSDVLTPDPQIAMSTVAYPVTAGDIYTLAFAAGATPVSYQISVDPTYKIRVANLATLDASGKTFLELKAQVEAVVTRNYPLSGVQFVILSPAIFQVVLKGEVKATKEIKAWGLTRLSSLVKDSLTEYSSIRDVQVRGVDGKTRVYDLFKAERFGDSTQDPYVRPGDAVTIGRVERRVALSGAVERPGTYQLLKNEGLADLIRVYGGGLTYLADPERIELLRYSGVGNAAGDKLYLNSANIESNWELRNFDSVTVNETKDLRPVMFLEGAVLQSAGDAEFVATVLEGSNRVIIRFNIGENYASLVRFNQARFSSVSDTQVAYILRAGQRLPINLNPILYGAQQTSEYFVEPNDVLIVPFRQYFVSVSGAVQTPGRYPYIPDRDWTYYVALAGGFDPERNAREKVSIRDISGRPLRKGDPILPETIIEASNNAFLYYFKTYSPVVLTTLSLVTTVFTIMSVTK